MDYWALLVEQAFIKHGYVPADRVPEQHPSRFSRIRSQCKRFHLAFKYLSLSCLNISPDHSLSEFVKALFNELDAGVVVEGVYIVSCKNNLPPLGVLPLDFILDNHREDVVCVQDTDGFPLVDKPPLYLLIESKPGIPEPQCSCLVESFVFDEDHPLHHVECILLLYIQLYQLPLFLNLVHS